MRPFAAGTAVVASVLFGVLPTTEALVLRKANNVAGPRMSLSNKLSKFWTDKVKPKAMSLFNKAKAKVGGPALRGTWTDKASSKNCLDWDKLNRTVEMTERASANRWSSDTLVREVAAQYCHEQNDKSPECLQKNAGMSIENRPVTSLTDVKDFSAKWDAAIRDAPECAEYKGFEWEVDVFVQQPETDRSATLHAHPMPLVTLTLPIQRETADDIQVPKVMCLSKDKKCQVELSAQLGRFFPLAAGLAHREQIDETNRIFMVLIPKTRNLLSFRQLKKSDKQGRDRTKSQWTRLDSLDGIINMWYPMADDPEKDGANRFLEYMKKP